MTSLADPPVRRSPDRRGIWNRQLQHYPDNGVRYSSLAIVVLATVTLYYQFYVAGGVATRILVDYHISFLFFVGINVIASLAGAVASIAAGLTDRYGRANVVIVGVMVTSLLCAFGIPNASTGVWFAVLYILVGFVEGIVLVATPALVRDFSPQLGRASAMGFWTLGPVLGSLAVAVQISSLSDATDWRTHFVVCGIFGVVVSILAFFFLKELAPSLRDQLMVSLDDRALLEARAKGIDVDAALEKPYRHMLKPDVIAASVAISVFLIIYYLAVGFFPIYFQTVFGMTQADANALGNWSWSFLTLGLLVVGYISDKLRVRKPFMLLGAISAIVFTVLFLSRTDQPQTSYGTFVAILIGLNLSLGVAFAPWMAAFTETVERRNPAMVATGLAVYGMIVRCIIAVSIFFVPQVVTTVTPLVEKGPVAAQLATQYQAELATAAAIGPEATAALLADPGDQAARTAAIGRLSGAGDAATAIAALGNVPAEALATLSEVQQAAQDSPAQWRTYFWIAVGGQLLFIPLIFFMAGFWSPRKARRSEEEHEAWLAGELAKLAG